MTARSLAATLAVILATDPASAQISSNPRILAPFKSVVAKASDSTVRVRGDDKDIALGTVVGADGYILTKASEIRGNLSVRLPDGTEYEAKLIASHRPSDLAMLKIDVADLKPINFADTKKVPVGNWLVSAGPTSDALAVGIVSVATRKLTGPDNEIDNQNRGYLGILMETADPTDKNGKVLGAQIREVTPKGAADKAGMKKNDIIISINGNPVAGRTSLRDTLENSVVGETVTVKVLREEKPMDFRVTLEKASGPLSRGDLQNSFGGELSGRRTGFPLVLQTDMVVSPRDCGGPVLDIDGNVLGVSIARAGRVETWILPSETIRPLLAELKAGKSTLKN
jgi:serine protease Do